MRRNPVCRNASGCIANGILRFRQIEVHGC
jgi:hypothetical protein